jgi:hypothetical protein
MTEETRIELESRLKTMQKDRLVLEERRDTLRRLINQSLAEMVEYWREELEDVRESLTHCHVNILECMKQLHPEWHGPHKEVPHD